MSRRYDHHNLDRLLQQDLLTPKEYAEELKIVDRYWDDLHDSADYDAPESDDDVD
jgi:hypothetical protein